MKRHHPPLIAAGLCVAILAACTPTDPASAPLDNAAKTEAPAGSQPLAEPATSEPAPEPPAAEGPASPSFAAVPTKGFVLRSTCRSGSCDWYRIEQVERTGGNTAPNYNLQVTPGESSHPNDPYPNRPDDVDIQWQSAAVGAQVMCSSNSPYAAVENHGERLSLSPDGVAGAVQGLANLYFAICHGEYGDDALLARKFGYDVR